MSDPNIFFRKVEALEIKNKSNTKQLVTRGIGLAKSKEKVKINLQTKKIQKDNALAELLKGTGMIIQNISLKHLP